MDSAKFVSTPIGQHFKLSINQSSKIGDKKKFMVKIPYINMVCSIMYVMVCSRPYLTYVVSLINRFMGNLGKGNTHQQALKWVFQYFVGLSSSRLCFSRNVLNGHEICGFVDSDFAENLDTRNSLTSYVFTTIGGVLSWKYNLQSVVALSTTKTEYI